jgi:glyoxylate reductase
LTRLIAPEAIDRLRAEDIVLDLWDDDLPPSPETLRTRASDADALLCLLTDRIDESLLDAAPGLRVISNMAAGTDNVDLTTATRRGIPVGNTPGVLTESTADFTFALLLATGRRVTEADRYVRGGRWATWGPKVLLGRDLHSATLGIIGFGAIGQAVARRARGFDARILYTRRSETLPPEDLGSAEPVSLPDLLERSDFVSIHVPLTAETRHLLGAPQFASMKHGSVLVNTARGSVIDQPALAIALAADPPRPAFAALDVTQVEPIPTDDPLLELPNVVLAPHIASAGETTRRAMANLAVDNLLAGLRGERMPKCANPEVYA